MKTPRILLVLPILLSGCLLETNTTSPQNSTSIKNSKEIKHFICEYNCLQEPEGMFSFNQIWAEQGWFNDIKGYKVVRTDGDFVNICFTLNKEKSLYRPEGYIDTWSVQDTSTSSYLGLHGYGDNNMYILNYNGKISPKKVHLIVYKKKSDSSYAPDIQVGTLTLIKK